MHLNPRQPNILRDMLSGLDLRNRDRQGNPIPQKPSQTYPYSSLRQNSRQARVLVCQFGAGLMPILPFGSKYIR